jgi:hypothetical protein
MTEQYNTPLVMMPGEMDGIIEDIIAEAEQFTNNCATTFKKLLKITDQLKYDWRSLWSAFGTSKEGWSHYQQLRLFTLQQVKTFHDDFVATNGAPIQQVITYCLLMPALNVSLVTKT